MTFQDDQGRVRTLVISGNSTLKGLCTDALQKAHGIECLAGFTHTDGAIDLLAHELPVVAVVDVDDFQLECALPLLNDINSERCVVIALVPHLDKSFVINALRSGVRGFLTREVNSRELVRAVKGVGASEIWVPRELLYEALMAHLHSQVSEHEADAAGTGLLELLTPRQKEIVNCLREGLSDKEIARSLNISPKTVKTHLQHIFRKTKIHSRLQLAVRG